MKFEISDEEYDNLIEDLRNLKLDCPIIKCKEKEIEDKYILINAIGEFLVTSNCKDEFICNYENINLNKLEDIYRSESK